MPSGPGTLLAGVAESGDVANVASAIADTVRAWVGGGPVFVATADPTSGAFTGTFTFGIPDDAARAFFDIEMAGRDVVSFRSLSGSPEPAGALYAATGGDPRASERWRDVISPMGWGDELRAVARVQGNVWGYLCLHREAAERRFAAKDVERLAALLPAVAGVLRRSALPETADPGSFGTGVIMVDHLGRMADATGGAAAWLEEMQPISPSGLPLLLGGIARVVLDSGRPVSTTISTRSGRIGLLEAAVLESAIPPQVAIVLSVAPAPHRLSRLAAAAGLTSREQELVGCVLRGLSTRDIADELVISPNTVQAHLTSIFAKTQLRSRRELVNHLR
jgi:DNA-binding CsgD family transcriptional regulator